MVHIIFILSGLVAGAIVCVILWKISKHRKNKQKQETQRQVKLNVINEIIKNANMFIGLYEPLHMIEKKRLRQSDSVFADWNTRIENLGQSSDIYRYWKDNYSGFTDWSIDEAAKKAYEFLSLLNKAGISRSTETNIIVSANVFKRYASKDGINIEPGTETVVELPYWSCGERILEKGLINLKEGGK